MTVVSRNVCIDNLNEIQKHLCRTIKLRHSDVESSGRIYFALTQNGYKDPKLKIRSLFGAIELNKKIDSDNFFYTGLLDLVKI